ncbi:hypothetical protein N2601_12680 [Rhizobium sp. CB3060]|uniref:hypothetical protein n=1 Tax=Rhizobium sp. CB3060 TaxID=3138255 RepID=UPI0021A3EBF8|nr:hypothetical protein [Rhizobium tropici]UWU20151.1 hypothetical protein N2601_12680 [Rhizobium tropici]
MVFHTFTMTIEPDTYVGSYLRSAPYKEGAKIAVFLPNSAGVKDKSKDAESKTAETFAREALVRAVGPHFSRRMPIIELRTPPYNIETELYSGYATSPQQAFVEVIDLADHNLGSIKINSVIVWHKIHKDEAEGFGPVLRMRVEASEGDKTRVLNLLNDETDDEGQNEIMRDGLALAAVITDLF